LEINISQLGKYYDAHNKIEKDYSISKILGIYENNLIVLLKGGIFIGLDVETGVLNWKQDQVEENNTKQTIDYNFGDVTNKVRLINKTTASGEQDVEFVYDPMGNRIAKKVYTPSGSIADITYYFRDAQGNTMR
jgi:hypothetical protein